MAVKTETLKINFGPHHPSTHGVLYVKAELDGEVIKNAEAIVGYLHRGMEKLAEQRYYHHGMVNMNRMDYVCGGINEIPYVMAIEKLAGIKVPQRAEYIRVIISELNRITGHQLAIGTLLNDLGATFTPLMYLVKDREMLLDLEEELMGSRMTPNFFRIGGVKDDLPEGWLNKLSDFLDSQEKSLKDVRTLIENEIFQYRCIGVGQIDKKVAINLGLTGPMLRATGHNWDIRKNDPYSVYDQFDFKAVVEHGGDLSAFYKVRLGEMYESIKILRQAIKQIPTGPIKTPVPLPFKPPKGDAYARIESPKGELGVYIVSDGTQYPYRVKLRAPCFCNLKITGDLVKGWKIADLIVLIGAIDPVMGDTDR